MFSWLMPYQNVSLGIFWQAGLFSCISQYVFLVLQDPKYFKSQKTGRGQLKEGWRETHQPIMCSYKLVTVKFEVWGLQTRVEQFVHKVSETGAVSYPLHKQNLSTALHRNVTRVVQELGSSAQSVFRLLSRSERSGAEPKSSSMGINFFNPGAAQI